MSSQSIPTTALPDTYEVQTNPLFHDTSSLPASSLPISSLSPFRGQITQESVPLRGNVLVPDSDVSGSQSQSLSGSQSIPYDASQSRLSVTGFGGPSHPSPEPRANKENQFTKSPTHKTSEATKETPESANEKSHRTSPTLSVTKQTDVAHPNSPPNPPQTAEPVPSLGLAQAISETYRGIEDGSYDLIPETREQDEAVIEVIRPRSPPINAAKRKRDHATSSSEDETPPKRKKSDIVDPVRPVEHSPPSWRSPAFLQKSRKSVAKDDILVQRPQTSEPVQKDILQSSRTSGSSLGKLDLRTNPSPPLVSSSGTKISRPSADRDRSQNTEAPLSTLKEPPGSASNGSLEKHEIHGDQQAQLSNRTEELRSEAHVERASSPEIPQPPDLDRRYTAHEKGKMKAIPSPEQKDDAVVPPEPARSAKSKPVIDAGLFARFHPGNGLDISAHADEAGIRLMNWRDLDGILTKTREAKAHANYS
ncbi:hypothetical protein SISNIDRAFT_453645 [Sistotremastrum niveocremeum HHB9708]|uniref:Uncharacterized protein n=1 Tax=Sistotremastrum niveocremeum HHB9708 TaxID=1314777 RepID=A0A164V8W3_9AGAM|nr:hypothetical protein SISNIDRAFT_453645 [Sistotremastrum niveocremeum HHB9708]